MVQLSLLAALDTGPYLDIRVRRCFRACRLSFALAFQPVCLQ